MPKILNILFAENHEMVRNGIKLMLAKQSHFFEAIIDDASNGVEALFKAQKNQYDVLLLDINLPLKTGIEVCRALKDKAIAQNVIFLTMHKELYMVKSALESGAQGYIVKDSGIGELTQAILTVSQGKKYYSNEIAQMLLDTEQQGDQKKAIVQIGNLTEAEIAVLALIVRGFTDKDIGRELNISPRTAGNRRYKLILKLGVKNSIELAAEAVRKGIV